MLRHMCHSSNYVMVASNVFIIIVHDEGLEGRRDKSAGMVVPGMLHKGGENERNQDFYYVPMMPDV